MIPLDHPANREYAEVYADSESWFPLRDEWNKLREAAYSEYYARVDAEKKRLKRSKGIPDPSDAFVEALRDEVTTKYARVNELNDEIDRIKKARLDRLYALAKEVEFAPTPDLWCKAKSSTTGSYRTQTDANSYARGELVPLRDRLKLLGIETHVRFAAAPEWGYREGWYELWASCPEWMADAAERTATFADALMSMKRAGVNPLVYNPYLPREMLEAIGC